MKEAKVGDATPHSGCKCYWCQPLEERRRDFNQALEYWLAPARSGRTFGVTRSEPASYELSPGLFILTGR